MAWLQRQLIDMSAGRRTRRWEFVKQDALRFASLGLSADEIAERLDVDRATVFRWKKAGKLTVHVQLPRGPLVVTNGETPAQWAASVRAAYALDATDDQLVTMAETALLLWRDPNAAPSLRFQAMREFRATVKQLALVARSAPDEKPVPAVEPPKRKTFTVQRRSGDDPRALLTAVK